MGQVDPAIASEPADVSKMNQLKQSLKNKLQSLSALDEGILSLTPADNVEEIVQADEIQERVYIALSKLELALTHVGYVATHTAVDTRRDTSPSTSEHEELPPMSTTAHLPATVTPTHGVNVKLPKISPHGDPVKWTAFWDAYKSAIHSNLELSEVDKFNYLLDRSALDAIAGLTLSSANYQQAIEIIHKRFGNKQSKHMDTLMSMQPITSDRNLKELHQLYDHT